MQTDLEKIKEALTTLGIPFEEKRFKVTTAIVITADDKAVFGRLGNFCQFKFENEHNDAYMHCGVYTCMAPEEGLRAAQKVADEFDGDVINDAEQDQQQDQEQAEDEDFMAVSPIGGTTGSLAGAALFPDEPDLKGSSAPPKRKKPARSFSAPPRKAKA